MSKYFLIILFCVSSFLFGQENDQWQGYFSYNNIVDLTQSNTKIIGASENALFTKNLSDAFLSTINSVDGFKPDFISVIYYSQSSNIIFVGNKNGLLLLIKPDGAVLQKRGIIDEVPVNPLLKNINHFYEHNNKVYISCDYGISVFNLNVLEFGDTYNLGNNGQYGKIFQTTVFNNEIYAVTQFEGIKKAAVSNPNLVDFNQWQVFNPGFFNGIISFNNSLILSSYTTLSKFENNSFTTLLSQSQNINKLRATENFFTVTTNTNVYVFNQSISQVANISSNLVTTVATNFNASTVVNNQIYISTNQIGVISFDLSNLSTFEVVKPNGPEQNLIFRLKKSPSKLWAVYGKYNSGYNPYNPNPPYTPFTLPISNYSKENGWTTIPYSDLFGAKSLSNITFAPNNENLMYVSSFFSGLLKFENEEPTILYNNTNTGSNGLETLISSNPNYIDIRINGPAFDKNGNLWMTNSRTNKPLKVLRQGNSWQSYDFSDDYPTESEEYGILVIDKNNTKWIPSFGNGLIAFNEGQNNKKIIIKTGIEGNLPNRDVRCLAIDARNQLWIGTRSGLRIIQNVDLFLSQDEIQTRNIVILENDLAQELFFDQFILDIVVDGSNRKWVSIADSGVYLVSSNGQETIYHFTKDDSPLPSNNVLDIEIDGETGEVFFATERGLVSFKGTATKPSDNLNDVYVYPNPVRPDFDGTVKISGLTDKANVKITDVAGNLVFETTSLGGTIEWDTTAFGNYKVASGVYMIFIAAQDGIDTTVKKVMIVR